INTLVESVEEKPVGSLHLAIRMVVDPFLGRATDLFPRELYHRVTNPEASIRAALFSVWSQMSKPPHTVYWRFLNSREYQQKFVQFSSAFDNASWWVESFTLT